MKTLPPHFKKSVDLIDFFNLQKKWAEGTECYIYAPLQHRISSVINTLHLCGAFVTTDELNGHIIMN